MAEHYILRSALQTAFGTEWDKLTRAQQDAVAADATELAEIEPNVSYAEYRARIGVGNLTSYANVLCARGARRP